MAKYLTNSFVEVYFTINGATVSAAVTLKIISSNYNFCLGSLDGDALAIAFKWLFSRKSSEGLFVPKGLD